MFKKYVYFFIIHVTLLISMLFGLPEIVDYLFDNNSIEICKSVIKRQDLQNEDFSEIDSMIDNLMSEDLIKQDLKNEGFKIFLKVILKTFLNEVMAEMHLNEDILIDFLKKEDSKTVFEGVLKEFLEKADLIKDKNLRDFLIQINPKAASLDFLNELRAKDDLMSFLAEVSAEFIHESIEEIYENSERIKNKT